LTLCCFYSVVSRLLALPLNNECPFIATSPSKGIGTYSRPSRHGNDRVKPPSQPARQRPFIRKRGGAMGAVLAICLTSFCPLTCDENLHPRGLDRGECQSIEDVWGLEEEAYMRAQRVCDLREWIDPSRNRPGHYYGRVITTQFRLASWEPRHPPPYEEPLWLTKCLENRPGTVVRATRVIDPAY